MSDVVSVLGVLGEGGWVKTSYVGCGDRVIYSWVTRWRSGGLRARGLLTLSYKHFGK